MVISRANGSEARTSVNEGDVIVAAPDDDGGNKPDSIDNGIPVIDPTTIIGEPDSGEPIRRKRGRPAGSRNGYSTKPQAKQTNQDLTGILLSLHMMGAAILKVPELEIDATEAKRLGDAVSRVNELYGGIMLSEKQAAWINLTFALGQVYGPRAVALKMRMSTEEKSKTIESHQIM